jgi:NADPH:quinone reductase-like Zn-dependent oxidoreductase
MTSEVQPGAVEGRMGLPGPADGLMRAVVQDRYGPVEALRADRVAVPHIAAGEVLLRVRAASVHIGDWHLMTGSPYLMRVMGFGLRAPTSRVRGTDAAGTVVAAGSAVTRFRPGDEVFGTCHGSFAEYAAAPERTLALRPAGLTVEHAAALPTSACTALQALRDAGRIRSGQRVLVIGASGGVGLFAVQIARALGAAVTGVCGPAKADLVRSLGVDRVVDYTEEDVTSEGRRYDLVLDLGGNRTLSQLRRVLTPRGTLVLVGGEGRGRWVGGAMLRSLRALVLSPFVRQRLRMVAAAATSEDLTVLAELVRAGQVTPVLGATYPLHRVPDALRALVAGQARGKLVIPVLPDPDASVPTSVPASRPLPTSS